VDPAVGDPAFQQGPADGGHEGDRPAQVGLGIWVLAATTGMRRSELAGAEREFIDLDGGTLGLHLDLAPHITDDRADRIAAGPGGDPG
jgi:hypothetical protein